MLLQFLWGSPASAQTIDEVLAAVGKNVSRFQDLLPDFVCNERITSTQFDSGKIIKQKVVESTFTGIQRSSEEKEIRFAFTESREVLTVNGKPVAKGTPFPKLPYLFSGGFGSLLITTFAPENLAIHDYFI